MELKLNFHYFRIFRRWNSMNEELGCTWLSLCKHYLLSKCLLELLLNQEFILGQHIKEIMLGFAFNRREIQTIYSIKTGKNLRKRIWETVEKRMGFLTERIQIVCWAQVRREDGEVFDEVLLGIRLIFMTNWLLILSLGVGRRELLRVWVSVSMKIYLRICGRRLHE